MEQQIGTAEFQNGSRKRDVRRTFKDIFLIVCQCMTAPFDFVAGSVMRIAAVRPKNLLLPPGTLILSNHQNYTDPFFITYYLGHRNWPRVLPCRYPVKSIFFNNSWLELPIRVLGGYNIGATSVDRAKMLLFTRQLLDERRTVILFPEGAITTNGEMIGDFQMGAQMLFSQPYPVVFVRLKGFTKSSWWRSFKTGGFSITYSEVMQGSAEEKLRAMHEFFKSK